MQARKIIAAFTALMLLATACGGGSSGSDNAPSAVSGDDCETRLADLPLNRDELEKLEGYAWDSAHRGDLDEAQAYWNAMNAGYASRSADAASWLNDCGTAHDTDGRIASYYSGWAETWESVVRGCSHESEGIARLGLDCSGDAPAAAPVASVAAEFPKRECLSRTYRYQDETLPGLEHTKTAGVLEPIGTGNLEDAQEGWHVLIRAYSEQYATLNTWLSICGETFDPDDDWIAPWVPLLEKWWQDTVEECRAELAPLGLDCVTTAPIETPTPVPISLPPAATITPER